MILGFKCQESPRETRCSWTWFPNQGEHFIPLLERPPWSALCFLLSTALRTLMESCCLFLRTNCFWEATGLGGRQRVWKSNSSKPVAGQHQSAFYQSFLSAETSISPVPHLLNRDGASDMVVMPRREQFKKLTYLCGCTGGQRHMLDCQQTLPKASAGLKALGATFFVR